MAKLVLIFASLVLLVAIYLGKYVLPTGYCPAKPKTMSKLDLSQYVGEWYLVHGLPTFFVPSGSSCFRATYGLKEHGSMSVLNEVIEPNARFKQVCGYADIPNADQPAQLDVHFPFFPWKGDYWVLDTDYDNYASIYTCQDNFGLFKIELAWILAKDPGLKGDKMDKALAAFTKQNIDIRRFEKLKHQYQ